MNIFNSKMEESNRLNIVLYLVPGHSPPPIKEEFYVDFYRELLIKYHDNK
jgi:hypothetical protein